jgi:hypothetical protein
MVATCQAPKEEEIIGVGWLIKVHESMKQSLPL